MWPQDTAEKSCRRSPKPERNSRNPDRIADAPLFERRVEPADASKAAAGLGIVGISRTELRPRWRVEVRLPCQAMAARKPGHRTRAPLPTPLAPFFLASPVLLSKHVFTPITELGPIARLLSAFERTIAIARSEERRGGKVWRV